MSVEMYEQQQAISELQQCEEELIDQHKLMIEFLQKFIPEAKSLYDTTNCVEYDQDGESFTRNFASTENVHQFFYIFFNRILQTRRGTLLTTG